MSFSTQCCLEGWNHVHAQNGAEGIPAACKFKLLSSQVAAEEALQSPAFGLLCQMSSGDLTLLVMSMSYEKYVTENGFTLKYPVIHLPVVF